jgi:hypothetical protein
MSKDFGACKYKHGETGNGNVGTRSSNTSHPQHPDFTPIKDAAKKGTGATTSRKFPTDGRNH